MSAPNSAATTQHSHIRVLIPGPGFVDRFLGGSWRCRRDPFLLVSYFSHLKFFERCLMAVCLQSFRSSNGYRELRCVSVSFFLHDIG